METGLKIIVYLLLMSLTFSACDQFEMRGFIFSYESADRRFEQSVKWNEENPYQEFSTSENAYSIAVMADSHVGKTTNLSSFIDDAAEADAVALVMAGDLTNGHDEDYAAFKNFMDSRNEFVYFPMVGNHDLYFGGWRHFYLLFGSSTYLFTVKTPDASDLFICTDTGSGTLGREQLGWLKDILSSERHKHRHCILFTHNNLFRIRHTTSTNPFVEELRVITELTVKHQIDMVIAGHDHAGNVVQFGNTTHITLDALAESCKNAGWLKLQINNDNIEYEFVKL